MIKLFTKFVSVTIILQLLIGNSAVVLAAKVKDEIIKENKEIIKEENLEIVDSNKIENSENTKNKTDLKEKVKEKVDEIKDKTDTGDEDPAIKEGDPTPTTEIPPQNPEPQNPLDFLKGFQGKYETDLFTGASTFNYQIWLPKGRNLNPSISIGYSSSNTNLNGIIGYGWDISNSYIFRNATKGVDKIYNSDDFSAVIFGGYNELVSLGSGVYGAKTESDFKKWQFSNNTWTVTDTNGTIYTFGSTSSSRQDNPNDFSKIFKWMLEKVQDTNGNFISFTYSKDSGQIYPDKIRYTGNGSDQGIYEVKFNLVARNSSVSSFRTGFEVKTNFLIDNIKINSYDTGFSKEIRAYKFGYTYNGALAQLTKITVYGGTESFPDTKFSYFPNNLLKKVELPAGGIFQLTYKKSSAYRESDQSLANENLPFPIDTVHSESLQASSADIAYTTYYDYEGGHYYYDNLDAYKKEYAGFHSIAITDPLNNKKKLSFHQSEFSKDNINSVLNGEYDDHISKKGKIYREEFYDNLGKLFKLIIRKWDKKTLTGTNRYFVFLKNQIEIDYDGDSSYKAKANAYEYDNYGNFLKNTDYGEVSLNSDGYNFTDVLNDKIVQDIEYASNSSKYIYALPQKQTLTDYYSNKIGETKIYYDKLSLGSVDKGNLTKTEKLVDSTGKIIKNEIDYNSFGLPNKYRNGKNYQTEIIYDSFNLFPYQIKNPKSQITTFTYNYFFGQISQITDPNNSKKVFQYDGLGRLKEVDLSNPHADSGTIKKTGYTYDTISYPNSVTQTDTAYNVDVNSKVIYVTTKIYFDGLNRKIQIRHETEGTDKYIVSSIIYDELGNLKKELLPKVLSGLSFSTPSLSDIGNQYSYDCLNRILQISNVLGATTFSYNDWKKTLIDANSKKKEFLYDARGNLTQVNEFLNSVSYATKYEYDFLKNLTKITDASGNIKNFTYDLLGRNLSQEILHKPTETNFKKYTFQYDDNNNLLIQTDPKGQIVNYSYDELDRILTEDFPNDAGVNVQYVYDQGIYGVGRLSSVMNYDYNYQSDYIFEKSFTYDILGRVLSDSEIFKQGNINKIYTTSYDYDFLGNIFNTIYPDSTEVLYIYDNSDKVEKILLNNQTLISKIDHSAIGTISEIDYVNGVISKNTYDINKLYRLTRKQTYKNSTYLQNISYSFDAVGNVLNITDSSNTNSAKIADYTYDDLHRLSTAIITNTPQNKNYIETYAYDITGNILVKSDLGNYQYNDKNPQAVTRAGNVSYSYDDNGNLLTDGTYTYTWDYKNRLINSQPTAQNPQLKFSYDESGNRVLKENISSGEKTYYVNKFYEVENSQTTSSSKFTKYIYAGDIKVADEIITEDNSLRLTKGKDATTEVKSIKSVFKNIKHKLSGSDESDLTEVIFHHTDHLSGSNVDTDINGNTVEVLDYYPYGNVRLNEKSGDYKNKYKFTGKELDEETNLYYYGARYYNAKIGRFVSADPLLLNITLRHLLNPQKLNAYSYVLNNPLKYIDIDGFEESFFSNVTDFAGGVLYSVIDNVTLGQATNNVEPINSNAFDLGESVGNAISTALGVAETIVGGGITGGGLVSAPVTGPAAVGISAVGVAVITYALAVTMYSQGSELVDGLGNDENIPEKVNDVLNEIKKTGQAPSGYKGGDQFTNKENLLPKTDAHGNEIQYQEWDINPLESGKSRGTERVVTGSDGNAYYTNDHYNSFTKIKPNGN